MKKPNSKNDLLQIRVESKIIQNIEDLISDSVEDSHETTKSEYVRELIMHDYLLKKRSPYYSKNSNIIVYVNEIGDFIYLRSEDLSFNNKDKIYSLPAKLEIKKEKFDYYLKQVNTDKEKNIKNKWIQNEFYLCKNENNKKIIIEKKSDIDGINVKQVTIGNERIFVMSANFTRESFAILKDYAQYYEDIDSQTESYDSLRVFVDIPTNSLDILVIINNDLYKNTNVYGGDFRPKLSFDLRNGEDIIMDNNFTELDSSLQPSKISNSYPRRGNLIGDEKYNETINKIYKSINNINNYINEDVYQKIKIPEKFLFYNLIVRNVHIGLTWSINWPKPQRY